MRHVPRPRPSSTPATSASRAGWSAVKPSPTWSRCSTA